MSNFKSEVKTFSRHLNIAKKLVKIEKKLTAILDRWIDKHIEVCKLIEANWELDDEE